MATVIQQERPPAKWIPIMGFTIANGLILDLDGYEIENALNISLSITKKYRCGDVLMVLSNNKGQRTLFGDKAYNLHAIFGAELTQRYIHEIVEKLADLHIVERLFSTLHGLEGDLTIRVAPKKVGGIIPRPIIYMKIDGRDFIIKKYLNFYNIGVNVYKEVYCK